MSCQNSPILETYPISLLNPNQVFNQVIKIKEQNLGIVPYVLFFRFPY